jgi:hypothetical protein
MLERSDFRFVSAAIYMCFARSVAGLATLTFALPVGFYEAGMRCLVEAFEFSFMTSRACLTAHVIIRIGSGAVSGIRPHRIGV